MVLLFHEYIFFQDGCFCLFGLLIFLLLLVMAFLVWDCNVGWMLSLFGCSCLGCLTDVLLNGCIDGGSVLIGCGGWCFLMLYFFMYVRWGTLSLIWFFFSPLSASSFSLFVILLACCICFFGEIAFFL